MNRRIKLAVAGGVVAIALALSVGVGLATPELLWSVFGSSGNSSSSTNFDLSSTSGQSSPIGASSSTNYNLNAGFWNGIAQPGGKLTKPGDTDGDGCPDEHENGPDETQGGLRDWENPYDYYDVLGPGAALPKDGVIDLPNDILSVILNFASSYPLGDPAAPGLPGLRVDYDRGPATVAAGGGPNVWNMTAPDGAVDLPNDILGVILQFGHNCV